MAQIIPKLNLNKTPALVESNSLVFAKNIRLDVDGTIHRDYGVFPMSITKEKNSDTLINYKNILNRIISDILTGYNESKDDLYLIIYNRLNCISGKTLNINNFIIKDGKYNIVGIIPNSNEFYIFINGTYKQTDNTGIDVSYTTNCIICYDEKEDKFYPCNCNWNWSGGTINGCVINNLVGDKILNIGESGSINLIPLKSINLNTATINDDESIYTQVPNIPITNLSYAGSFSCVIPNGVYQFFVRYKIRKDFYTDWFPASSEIFVGNKNSVITSFGTLKYTNIHRDSDNSFVLSAEHIINKNKANYESYQIGFILSHDDATYARAWKHFDFNITSINFDYKAEDAEEIELADFLKSTYGLYNVGNITTFKNKLYISNYTETEFNDRNLQTIADKVTIIIGSQQGGNTYAGNPILTSTIGSKTVISGLTINEVDTPFIGESGLFNKIISTKSTSDKPSIKQAIEACLNNSADTSETNGSSSDSNGIRITARIDSLQSAKNSLSNTYKNTSNSSMKVSYTIAFNSYEITDIKINNKNANSEDVLKSIYNTPRYLNDDCKWINASGIIDDSIKIEIARKATITETTTYYSNNGGFPSYNPNEDITDGNLGSDITRPNTGLNGGGSTTHINIFDAIYYQTIDITFVAWKNQYTNDDATTLINNTTLIPYQKYKFYMHFVKSTGEVTNGYYCSNAGEIEVPYMQKCNSVLYPIFNNITIPNDYVACFFSISHSKINTATVFNIADDPSRSSKEGSCIDVNMMLIPGNKKIHIRQGTIIEGPTIPPIINNGETDIQSETNIQPKASLETKQVETYSGQYYYSSDSSLPRYFGADGVIVFDKKDFDDNKLAYIVNDYSISETENIELIKCTPYLNKQNLQTASGIYYFDEYPKMNLLGFICCITPLIRDVCAKYYSDGSSVYFKSNDADNVGTYNPTGTLYLDELSKYNDAEAEKKLANFSLKNSDDVYIYSNYNLNYVTLSEEPKMVIKTFYNRAANSSGSATESQENDSRTILLRLIPSQLMSDIYDLPSMYKSYVRKTYSTYTENEIIRFDNTVRSSILYGDENKINVLTFDANDYYNIPTNRGIIVNMVSIGDAILVHTKDSMFKFSGSNTIQSSDGEIQTPESKPFDTGVSEIFGSDFGFAGLQNKSDHIITENGYIFFDRDSRIVYLYSGQGQIIKISESIEKLFRHKNIANINFANDYYNNRFFMSIMFYEDYLATENEQTVTKQRYYPVTLSFNTSEQIKSFVSLHDFYYHYAFNTKTKCYFLTDDNKDICDINKKYKGCYTKLEFSLDKTYPQQKDIIQIFAKDIDSSSSSTIKYNINSYNSIIDIITNDNFEVVKTLNAVNWCGTKIKSEFTNVDYSNPETKLVAEDLCFETPCKYIRIYTDTCMTPLNPCTKRANDANIRSTQSYKYPRFNQGFWTFNYFRNILNSKGHNSTSSYMSDNNSLIEGKYFVTRFIFDDDFKFETISLNYNNKIIG